MNLIAKRLIGLTISYMGKGDDLDPEKFVRNQIDKTIHKDIDHLTEKDIPLLAKEMEKGVVKIIGADGAKKYINDMKLLGKQSKI
jgi:hypothetical protein